MILDGTVIPADRCREKTLNVSGEIIDLWYPTSAKIIGTADVVPVFAGL